MKDERPRTFKIETDQNVGFNKKYTTIAIYAILVLLAVALAVYFLLSPDRLDSVFATLKSVASPILIGLILAYLLYPIYRFFEKKVFISPTARKQQRCRKALFQAKLRYDFEVREHPARPDAAEAAARALSSARLALKEANDALEKELAIKNAEAIRRHKRKNKRPSFTPQSAPAPSKIGKSLSILTTYLLLLVLITVFIWMIVPPCIESIGDLLLLCRDYITHLPSKLTSFELGRQIRDLLREFGLADDVKGWIMGLTTSLLGYLSAFLTKLPVLLGSWVSNLTDLILGIFLSIYFITSHTFLMAQFKRLAHALLPRNAYHTGRHILHEVNRKFGKYIQGKLTSSAILGIFSFILFWIVDIPYFQMITVICTVTNLIPFFGPFIGAIPSGVIILIADPQKLIIFAILVLIIQQIEGNILEPYILGDSLGLSPVWIMIAIVVMGELLGIIGMVLGVPLFAAVYTLISEACDRRLKRKNN